MALALILTTISPAVGGVLVRGEKGTAKSTMVRGLASVLPPIDVISGDRFSTDPRETHPLSPDGPFAADAPTESRPVRLVELPVGATEDRVLGSLHLEKALSEGVTKSRSFVQRPQTGLSVTGSSFVLPAGAGIAVPLRYSAKPSSYRTRQFARRKGTTSRSCIASTPPTRQCWGGLVSRRNCSNFAREISWGRRGAATTSASCTPVSGIGRAPRTSSTRR